MRVPHTILVDLWIVLALVVDSNELNRGVEIDILVILYSSTGELKHSHYPHNLNNLSTIISLSCAAEIYIYAIGHLSFYAQLSAERKTNVI